jgi:hypothetical protein
MPCSLAWEAFGEANGARSLTEMRERIARYRRVRPDNREDFTIGCRVLTQPLFFEQANWLGRYAECFSLTEQVVVKIAGVATGYGNT